ncbi:MAG: CopG family transcriptional regulator [Candidatus Aureabacteria bacterium]|nr:CopG family transcriptional regulator [Candidatus Auribacterota bacterium]
MGDQTKREVITFKADGALSRELKGLGNRSSFIRDAILSALESACPLCRGTGILTPDQKKHWDAFARDHPLTECSDCHAFHLVCSRTRSPRRPRR